MYRPTSSIGMSRGTRAENEHERWDLQQADLQRVAPSRSPSESAMLPFMANEMAFCAGMVRQRRQEVSGGLEVAVAYQELRRVGHQREKA